MDPIILRINGHYFINPERIEVSYESLKVYTKSGCCSFDITEIEQCKSLSVDDLAYALKINVLLHQTEHKIKEGNL